MVVMIDKVIRYDMVPGKAAMFIERNGQGTVARSDLQHLKLIFEMIRYEFNQRFAISVSLELLFYSAIGGGRRPLMR